MPINRWGNAGKDLKGKPEELSREHHFPFWAEFGMRIGKGPLSTVTLTTLLSLKSCIIDGEGAFSKVTTIPEYPKGASQKRGHGRLCSLVLEAAATASTLLLYTKHTAVAVISCCKARDLGLRLSHCTQIVIMVK